MLTWRRKPLLPFGRNHQMGMDGVLPTFFAKTRKKNNCQGNEKMKTIGYTCFPTESWVGLRFKNNKHGEKNACRSGTTTKFWDS